MHTFINPKPETEVWEENKCWELLLNTSLDLIIPVTNELKVLNIEFKTMKEWKEWALSVVIILDSDP